MTLPRNGYRRLGMLGLGFLAGAAAGRAFLELGPGAWWLNAVLLPAAVAWFWSRSTQTTRRKLLWMAGLFLPLAVVEVTLLLDGISAGACRSFLGALALHRQGGWIHLDCLSLFVMFPILWVSGAGGALIALARLSSESAHTPGDQS